MPYALTLPDGSWLEDFNTELEAREYADHWLWLQGKPGMKITVHRLDDEGSWAQWTVIGVEVA